jgi:hypothetical protein
MRCISFRAGSVSTITLVAMPDNPDFQQRPGTQLCRATTRARHLLNGPGPGRARARRRRHRAQPGVPGMQL